MTHYWCQIVQKCEYLSSRGFNEYSSFFAFELGDLKSLHIEGTKRRKLAEAIEIYDDIKHLLWIKGIAKVVDMRSTDKIFGAFRKALAKKIEAQKLLVKDLMKLSYSDVQVRFQDTHKSEKDRAEGAARHIDKAATGKSTTSANGAKSSQ